MTEKEQLEWCAQNRATVWFMKSGKVSIKVQDCRSSVVGATLEDAISHIEKRRAERREIGLALDSLNMR